MLEQTILQLRQLKLSGMANALTSQIEQPGTYEGLAFEDRLQLLADSESQDREHRKQQRLLKAAKFKLAANGQNIDYLHPRGLKQSMMASLLHCDWLNKSQNLLITGPCGTGKTYIACALGHTGCLKGYSVKYYRISRLMLALTQAKADGSYSRALQALAKVDLLILDDWGMETLTTQQRSDLLDIIDARHEQGSIIIMSQLPVVKWHALIGEATYADAIMDRLIHRAQRFELKGESMRKLAINLTEPQ
ncbi:MAG: ATP-binding protein [Alteromonadaceae bacterium]|nr:ATP-binding protein [Alteromonadaceae bacterium]